MTLILGIKCQDGVVMAADSAATMAVQLGPSTVVQKCTKLSPIGDLVIGTAGPVGLGQLFTDETERIQKSRNYRCNWRTLSDAKTALRNAMWSYAKTEWESVEVLTRSIGPRATEMAISSTLVAFPVLDKPCLVQFDCRCSPEHATEALPFITIGSGQLLADAFLAFIRGVLWPSGLPELQQGVFYAIWAVLEAIRVSPGGLAEPVQVVTLSKTDGSWAARELLPDELGEHRQAISDIQEGLRHTCEERWTQCLERECPKPPEPAV